MDKLYIIKRQKDAMRKLGEIAAISNQDPKETLRQALEVGKEHFGLEFAIVSHIYGDSYMVEVQSSPPDTLFDGQLFPLGVTYCNTTIEIDDVLAIKDVTTSKYVGHPCYKEFKLVSYIGAPVRVNGEIYGTINFSSPSAYPADYDETDEDFIRLLARWAGSFLERQHALDALKESEKRLQTIIEMEPECIKIIDKEGRLTYMNPAGLKMIEADSLEQVVGCPILDVIAPEYRDEYAKLHEMVMSGKNMKMQYEVLGLGGRRLWLETTAVLMKHNGETAHLAITRDISERKEQEDLRNLLLSSLGDGVYGIDINGKCTFINTAALQMLKLKRDEALSFDQHELFHHHFKDAEQYQKENCPVYLTMSDGQTREADDVFIDKNKKRFNIHLKVAPILRGGVITGAVVAFQDITERLKMEENLRSINRHLKSMVEEETQKRLMQEKLLIQQSKMAMMGEMIGAIAHQWKQPLNSLALIIQDVHFTYQCREMNDEYMEIFKNNAMDQIDTMSKTIEDFRNFFSPNKIPEIFFVEDAISESIKLLDSQLKIHNIEILFDANPVNKHSFTCYKNELKQVLLNILANAKDAILEKKPINQFIKIDIHTNHNELIISIEDSAGGIPVEIIDKIFDSHFTTKEASKGTGIGLYMSKQIVEESLGGKLTVENSKNGAKFMIISKI